MKVVVALAAELDLERIGDAIAADSPRRALSFVTEIRQSCQAIGDWPEAFPIVARYRKVGIRRRVHGNYLILYRVGRGRVVVLRVLHGAMNYEDLSFSDRGG